MYVFGISKSSILKVEAKCLYVWDKPGNCNEDDCHRKASYEVKYPKLKPISVCGDCFNKYYRAKYEDCAV